MNFLDLFNGRYASCEGVCVVFVVCSECVWCVVCSECVWCVVCVCVCGM